MLEQIQLQNFKACRESQLPIKNLTMLSGLNSSGKSSILQALSAIKQSYSSNQTPGGLLLNGDLIELGTGRDVLNDTAEDEIIIIRVMEDGNNYEWQCEYSADSDLLKFVTKTQDVPKFTICPYFQYLRADRIVPALMYPRAPMKARECGFLGTSGEYAVDFLHKFRDQDVPELRCFPDHTVGVTAKLCDQVDAWLQCLSPGVRFHANPVEGTDVLRLGFRYVGRKADVATDIYRPTNVGFGLTYILPIIVACLASPNGSLLLIENPEAHLHPQGQSAMGELLSQCAADGLQIIVETHSDHLLNGIRVAVKREIISPPSVAMHFFQRDMENGAVNVVSPEVYPNGRLSKWPDGFFDQWDKSLDELTD